MNSPEPERYVNQNLRRRSFQGENLRNADFRGADLRGCDFSYCNLTGANLSRVRVGKTPADALLVTVITLIVMIAAFHAMSQMLFAVMGLTPDDDLWKYVLALIISLAIAVIFAAMRHWLEHRRIATILSGAASSALLGFYYGGVFSNKNLQIAAITAAISAIIIAVFSYLGSGLVAIAVSVAGCIASYGLTFFVGVWAIIHLSGQSWLWGISLSLLTLILMAIALVNLLLAYREISHFRITSFRGANLTNTNFEGVNLSHANTSGAIFSKHGSIG